MKISANTKIAAIIRQNPEAIEAIASINVHFEKLRNPVLRKILASRIRISDAAKMGNSTVDVFFEKLRPLGFEVENVVLMNKKHSDFTSRRPAFMDHIKEDKMLVLDVRADIAAGGDPFKKIMHAVDSLQVGNVLLIINAFEPVPLLNLLAKRGFAHYVDKKGEELVYTYLKQMNAVVEDENLAKQQNSRATFNEVKLIFGTRIKEIDVRELEMPEPMVTILSELELLTEGTALFVHHKRVPQFLLPELDQRQFHYVFDEIDDENVKMLIYKHI